MNLKRLGEFRVLTLREEAPTLWAARACNTPEVSYDYWMDQVVSDPRHNPEVETLVGLVLSSPRLVLGHYIVATGTLDTILSHPREVFRPAILAAASAIVLMHNHPSGDPMPSEGDIKTTLDLIRAGQLLRIDVLDHVIVGRAAADRVKAWVSLRELGYFCETSWDTLNYRPARGRKEK